MHVRMLSDSEACVADFDALVKHLYEKNRINAVEGDSACLQYKRLLDEQSSALAKFARLDEFYSTLLPPHSELFTVIKVLLVLFHGNAPVERGFKVNQDFSTTNLQERSLRALRITYDALQLHMARGGQSLSTLNISEEMLASVARSRQNYRQFLEEEKRKAAVQTYSSSIKRKADHVADKFLVYLLTVCYLYSLR